MIFFRDFLIVVVIVDKWLPSPGPIFLDLSTLSGEQFYIMLRMGIY